MRQCHEICIFFVKDKAIGDFPMEKKKKTKKFIIKLLSILSN